MAAFLLRAGADPDAIHTLCTDQAKALAAGGQVPHELTCRGCNRDAAFVFSERLAKIRHWR